MKLNKVIGYTIGESLSDFYFLAFLLKDIFKDLSLDLFVCLQTLEVTSLKKKSNFRQRGPSFLSAQVKV